MASQTEHKRRLKTEQIGFKVELELSAALQEAAAKAGRPPNQLARLIFEWGFPQYLEAGSYEGLVALDRSGKRPLSDSDIDSIAEQEREIYGPAKIPGETPRKRKGRNTDK